MGAGSNHGSDSNTSAMGIVQGHAYSILDVLDLDGAKLIQLRNPWGNEVEWRGQWSDKSTQWTNKRKRIIYDRMKA
jgi:hypothetical protein